MRRTTGATAVFLLTRYSAVLERITLLTSLFLQTMDNNVSMALIIVAIQSDLTFGRGNSLCLSSIMCISPCTSRCVPVLRIDDSLTDISYASIGGMWYRSYVELSAEDSAQAFTALRLYGIYNELWPAVLIGGVWVSRISIAIVSTQPFDPVWWYLHRCSSTFRFDTCPSHSARLYGDVGLSSFPVRILYTGTLSRSLSEMTCTHHSFPCQH